VVAAYSLTMGMFMMSAATLSDARGRRLGYIGGIVLFCAASIGYGLAPSLLVLNISRDVQETAPTVIITAFVLVELRVIDPMMDVRVFADRVYSTAIITIFCVLFGIYGSLLLITQYFQNIRDYSAEDAGFLMISMTLPVIVLALIAGRARRRWSRRTSVSHPRAAEPVTRSCGGTTQRRRPATRVRRPRCR
jgi:predicted MFS family arabinose efflux permease